MKCITNGKWSVFVSCWSDRVVKKSKIQEEERGISVENSRVYLYYVMLLLCIFYIVMILQAEGGERCLENALLFVDDDVDKRSLLCELKLLIVI